MAKSSNQKLKLLYLKDYFERQTDEKHPTTTKKIIEYLRSVGIECERKTVYADIEELRRFGVDIVDFKADKSTYYFVGEREFELTELRLLIDAISTSRFLTAKKTKLLADKLSSLESVYNAEWLQGRIYNADSLKSLSEQIYLNMFKLHQALIKGKLVKFKYWTYTVKKERVYKRGGEPYSAAPYMFTYNDGNYYLVARDMDEGKLKTFRVDKIDSVDELDENAPAKPKESEIIGFVTEQFSMFDGETERVTLRFCEDLVGVVIDKFGKDVSVKVDENGMGVVSVKVKASVWFYSWIFGLGKKIEIVAPEEIRTDYIKYLKDNLEFYGTYSV